MILVRHLSKNLEKCPKKVFFPLLRHSLGSDICIILYNMYRQLRQVFQNKKNFFASTHLRHHWTHPRYIKDVSKHFGFYQYINFWFLKYLLSQLWYLLLIKLLCIFTFLNDFLYWNLFFHFFNHLLIQYFIHNICLTCEIRSHLFFISFCYLYSRHPTYERDKIESS
jgi:hypothetical protein